MANKMMRIGVRSLCVCAGVLIGTSGCVDDPDVEIADVERSADGSPVTGEVEQPVHAAGVLRLEGGESYRWTRTVLADGSLDERFFDESGRTVSAAEIERKVAASDEARWKARGAMSPDLFELWSTMSEAERIGVWGWMRLSKAPERREDGSVDREVEAESRAVFDRVLARLDERGRASAVHVDGPFVQLQLSQRELADLAWSGELIMLDPEWVDRGPASTGVWYQTIGDDLNVAAGWDGTGRRVAIVEPGAPPTPSNLGTITAQATPASAPGYYTDTHMQICAGVVSDNVAGQSQHGTAPAVGLLLANWAGFTGPEVDLRLWSANQGADAISISRAGIPWDANPNVNDLYNDWLTLRSPYPLIALAAGNDGANADPTQQYVHHRGYNTITVGASDDGGTASRSLDSIASFSSWKNSTSPYGDREMPEIAAPGVNYCAAGLCGSGTSLATPMVAATAAQMCERNSTLSYYPEAVKAMLMASADCNVSQVVLNLADSYDDKDGAGELNGRKAVNLAASSYIPSTFTTSGHAYGQINFSSASQWSGNQYIGQVFRARTDANGRITVVLTWDSTPVCTDQTSSASCSGWGPDGDLNLYLKNASTGSYTKISASRDNNYEYFIASALPNTDYYIELWKYGTPRNTTTYYGLAWINNAAACPNPT